MSIDLSRMTLPELLLMGLGLVSFVIWLGYGLSVAHDYASERFYRWRLRGKRKLPEWSAAMDPTVRQEHAEGHGLHACSHPPATCQPPAAKASFGYRDPTAFMHEGKVYISRRRLLELREFDAQAWKGALGMANSRPLYGRMAGSLRLVAAQGILLPSGFVELALMFRVYAPGGVPPEALPCNFAKLLTTARHVPRTMQRQGKRKAA